MIYNYIEYGVRNLNKKKILRYVTKQTAYDLWHLGVRFREKSKLIKLFKLALEIIRSTPIIDNIIPKNCIKYV